MGQVVISPNIKRTSERIDPAGNVIDPRTKQIIVPKQVEYVPPIQPISTPEAKIEPMPQPVIKDDGMSIHEQIKQAEANLEKLKEAKKVKIEQMKKELELLQQ
jgi:hypothetical protein